ncbi:MAG: hypothetical protein R6U62_07640, partial [Bacteroidales bacterium]
LYIILIFRWLFAALLSSIKGTPSTAKLIYITDSELFTTVQAGLGRPGINKKGAVVDAALGLRDLGRPAIYKKEAVVDAALGLRDLGRRTIYKKEQW